MPELPDVEGFRRLLSGTVVGRTVEGVRVPDPDVLRNTTPQALGRALNGACLAKPDRHGKWLRLPTDKGSATVWHFGMTGYPEHVDADESVHDHDRVMMRLSEGELRLHMMRKLGGLWLLRAGERLDSVSGELGPDALTVSRGALADRLRERRGSIKSALMDQQVLAGAGNLVVDEVLWRARIHPRADARSVDIPTLHHALRKVLRDGVAAGRVPPRRSWLTGARDAEHPRCPRCGSRLAHDRVTGRSTAWCPNCQPG